jgi:hypothetical protein
MPYKLAIYPQMGSGRRPKGKSAPWMPGGRVLELIKEVGWPVWLFYEPTGRQADLSMWLAGIIA